MYILIIKQKNDGKALFKCTNMWLYSLIAWNYHFMLNLAMKYKKKIKNQKIKKIIKTRHDLVASNEEVFRLISVQ